MRFAARRQPPFRVPPLAIVVATVFIDLVGFGIIIPLLPFYAESYGASALAVGLLGTTYSFMQFVCAPLWGRWSDRVGRRPIILVGLAGSAVSYLTLALAASLPVIFLARLIGGAAGANIAAAQAYVADVTAPEERARGMGLVGVAFGLGFVFGPAIGGVLSHFGPEVPMFFAAGLCATNFAAAWFLLPESRGRAHGAAPSFGRLEALRRALARPELVLLLALYFIIMAAFSGFEVTFALFSERRFGFTTATIGYLFAFVGIVLAVVQGTLVGPVVRRAGEARVVPAALAAVALGLGLVPFAPSVPGLLAALAVLACGMGFNGPSLSAMVSRLSPPDDQGAVLGAAQSLAALGRIVGPAWGGFLFDQAGIEAPYLSAAAIMTVACVVALASLSRQRTAGP